MLAGAEKALIYNPKYTYTGFVDYISERRGEFNLMPSIVPTPADDVIHKTIYVMEHGEKPYQGDLIEVSVRETWATHKPEGKSDKGPFKKIEYKKVFEWHDVDPNSIKGPKNITRGEFIDFLSMPFQRDLYSVEDIATCMGLYAVACPAPSNYEQGGIYTSIQSKFYDNEKKGALNRMMGVLPPEFLKRQYRNFYQLLETPTLIRSPESLEVSLSWFNVPAVDPHIPITINADVKGFSHYKDYYTDYLEMARSFVIDAVFYQPKITDEYMKKFEETLYEIRQVAWTEADQGKFNYNFVSATPRIAMAFARLNFRGTIDTNDLKNTAVVYEDAVRRARNLAGAATTLKGNPKVKGTYDRSPEEKMMLSDIFQLRDTGQELTISNLKKITKVPADKFWETINKLRNAAYIYLPRGNQIGIIE